MPEKLSHYDESGAARMVDVSAKTSTRREAVARAFVELSPEVLRALPQNPKGNPLEVARFAGIQAAKRTSDLIPMCHPVPISFVDVSAEIVQGGVADRGHCSDRRRAPAWRWKRSPRSPIAALTVYDMTKALDKAIRIRGIELVRKTGGSPATGGASPNCALRPPQLV